ncbi:MAG: phage tail protein [Bacillota bacterium]
MSDPYVGEIRMFAGTYAPEGWALCDGQILSIAENQQIFALIGTTYGGDGQTTFRLPDLRGRIPISIGRAASGHTYQIGQAGGAETVTLSAAQMPAHSHRALALEGPGTAEAPAQGFWATLDRNQYFKGDANAPMSPQAIESTGQGQPHDNLMPYLAVNFIICLTGLWPNRQ